MNCRLCLIKCEDAVPIFTDNGNESVLKSIFQYLHLKIQPDDIYSTILCQNCTRNLQNFHNFFQCIQKCQSSLQPMKQEPAATSTLESIQWDPILKKSSIFDKDSICSLCLNECEDDVSIIEDKNSNSWLQWVHKYLILKFEPGDVYSSKKCRKCTKNLQDFHNFYQSIQNCQLSLKNMNITENETNTIDSTAQRLSLKKESEQAVSGSFSHTSVKTELMSAEEESDTCENVDYLEDSVTSNELIGEGSNEAIVCDNCGTKFAIKEMLNDHFEKTQCKRFVEVETAVLI